MHCRVDIDVHGGDELVDGCLTSIGKRGENGLLAGPSMRQDGLDLGPRVFQDGTVTRCDGLDRRIDPFRSTR